MLSDKLQADQIAALKAGDKVKLNVIRFILSRVKNKEIEKQAKLSDDDVIALLKKLSKEVKESIEMYEKGGRNELVEEHKKQLEVISSYIPEE